MFEAAERQNFLDLLRPPPGYRLEAAVGTTYSLDFVALTAALLAFVDAEVESEKGAAGHVDSLHAITRLADRVAVFVNRGQIPGPREVNKLTILYDRIIHEVCLPEGCFHPKVWVAYYHPRRTPGAGDRPSLIRMICSSRNLTTSQCWEAFVACEGEAGHARVAGALNTGIRDFLGRVSSVVQGLPPAISRLREALNRTTFAMPRPLREEAAFLWQWHDGQALLRSLPPQGDRALVVSPFVRRTFLEDILNRFTQIILVSTQHELDAIQDEGFIAKLCGGKNRVYVVEPGDVDGGGSVMDLHAKLMVFEGPNGTKTMLGSANASPSAWKGRNCEAVVRFAPGVTIDHFCDRFIYGEEPAQPGCPRPLRGWISVYQRQPYSEDDEDRAAERVDEICGAIARLSICAAYDAQGRTLQLSLGSIPPELPATLQNWAESCNVEIGLLSQLHSDAALRPLNDLVTNGIHLVDVEMADLTEFLVVQVTHRRPVCHRRFIVKARADFSQWQDQRDAQLLQRLLTRDNLQAFLKAILFDASACPPAAPKEPTGTGKGKAAGMTLLSDISIEDVIRSCTEDSSRIEEIGRVLKAFEGTEWIDEEFRRFWSTFVAAEAEAREVAAHG